ncbi:EamA family transporter RarD [Salinibius halmophilus]|uniref:EamA family transporter RarD n=1 Tax=Salinibius halmophilus TaxID=1853216 RepID=UPI000E663379|nr:EamA family transporter RarD [Salinibius halmophilus]
MQSNHATSGVFFALSAYVLWGVAPVYFKQLPSLAAPEIVLYRVIWTVIFTLALVALIRQRHAVAAVLAAPKTLMILFGSGLVIGANWLIFIWAVVNEQMVQASLGYFINPLVNVLFGLIFFSERLRRMQWLAVAIATIMVSAQVIAFGQVPWIALALAVSFGIYGVLRKHISLPAIAGLFLESLVLLPFALVYLGYLLASGTITPLNSGAELALTAGLGVVTAAPLLFFTAAASRMRLITLGFFQYIGPSLMFVIAISFYDEQVTAGEWLSFAAVWLALMIYTWDSWRAQRERVALHS